LPLLPTPKCVEVLVIRLMPGVALVAIAPPLRHTDWLEPPAIPTALLIFPKPNMPLLADTAAALPLPVNEAGPPLLPMLMVRVLSVSNVAGTCVLPLPAAKILKGLPEHKMLWIILYPSLTLVFDTSLKLGSSVPRATGTVVVTSGVE